MPSVRIRKRTTRRWTVTSSFVTSIFLKLRVEKADAEPDFDEAQRGREK
jgi:hypothetical protein